MCKEMRILSKVLIKNVILIISAICLFMLIIGQVVLSLVFSLGLIVATINFVLSGVIFEKSIASNKKIIKYIFPLSHIFRITTIVIIAYPFIYNIEELLAYIVGFISFFIILIISWIKMQRGVNKWIHTNL